MKAFAIEELGRPGSVVDLEDPAPGEGEVRIRVAAAGVNPFDNAVIQGYLKDRMEHRFPLIPGMDASGTVDAVGAGAGPWSVGDEVFGSVGKAYLGGGTLAELATMSIETVARKPSAIEHPEAAAIPVAGVTALLMVEAMELTDGDTVVAIGATGGVGSYLVQLAAAGGARVVAICSGANADFARTLGATDVVDYAAGDVVDQVRARFPDGVDAIADMHGDADALARLAELVPSGGHVTSAVGAADTDALGARGIGATNVSGHVTTASLETIAEMLERGRIKSPELQRFPLAKAGRALELAGSGHVRGKIVVVPSS